MTAIRGGRSERGDGEKDVKSEGGDKGGGKKGG